MTRSPIAPVVLAAATCTGCATIMHGSRQDVSIASVPTGAEVTINGRPQGKTPVAVDLPRKDKHLLRVVLPGYLPFESYLTRKISGWVWGNLVFGGIPGLAIDAITGGLYNVKPDDVTATLAPEAARAAEARPAAEPAAANPLVAPVRVAPAERDPGPALTGHGSALVVLGSTRVRVVTEPLGAGVFIGATKIGTTTADGILVELPSGRVTLRFEADGFETAERELVVPESGSAPSGETAVVVVRLRPSKV